MNSLCIQVNNKNKRPQITFRFTIKFAPALSIGIVGTEGVKSVSAQ